MFVFSFAVFTWSRQQKRHKVWSLFPFCPTRRCTRNLLPSTFRCKSSRTSIHLSADGERSWRPWRKSRKLCSASRSRDEFLRVREGSWRWRPSEVGHRCFGKNFHTSSQEQNGNSPPRVWLPVIRILSKSQKHLRLRQFSVKKQHFKFHVK